MTVVLPLNSMVVLAVVSTGADGFCCVGVGVVAGSVVGHCDWSSGILVFLVIVCESLWSKKTCTRSV